VRDENRATPTHTIEEIEENKKPLYCEPVFSSTDNKMNQTN
jgi:hypothetical protein